MHGSILWVRGLPSTLMPPSNIIFFVGFSGDSPPPSRPVSQCVEHGSWEAPKYSLSKGKKTAFFHFMVFINSLFKIGSFRKSSENSALINNMPLIYNPPTLFLIIQMNQVFWK